MENAFILHDMWDKLLTHNSVSLNGSTFAIPLNQRTVSTSSMFEYSINDIDKELMKFDLIPDSTIIVITPENCVVTQKIDTIQSGEKRKIYQNSEHSDLPSKKQQVYRCSHYIRSIGGG